jgi:hypothetical protein
MAANSESKDFGPYLLLAALAVIVIYFITPKKNSL